MRLFTLLLLGTVFCKLGMSDVIRGPYLQQATSDQITIVWRSQEKWPDARVEIQQDSKAVESASVAILTKEIEQLNEEPIFQYEATVTNLEPAANYEYSIFRGTELVPNPILDGQSRFRTYPVTGLKDTKSRIWVVGDSGTGGKAQLLVHEAMKRHVDQDQQPLDLYLHVGDMAYLHGTDQQFQERFFEPYADTLCKTVCWASMGNHEGKSSNGKQSTGPFYDAYICPTAGEAGGVASANESYYSFDYGDIHFICLNSYDVDRTPKGLMAKWLVKDLQANQSQWLIAFWHHPPYTKGSHDSDTEIELIEMREHIMPILESHGVDLVLSGHSHIYERSMLIDGAYATPTVNTNVVFDDGEGSETPYRKPGVLTPNKGTIAIVTGHGGALVRRTKGVMPIMKSIALDHGSLILDVDGDTLSGTMIDSLAKIKDQFSIVKSGETAPVRLEKPWRPDSSTIQYGPPRVSGRYVPDDYDALIPKHSEWQYLADGTAPDGNDWKKENFSEQWPTGKAGFGYGDDDDQTELEMKNKFATVYIRKEFTLPADVNLNKLSLAIKYDDAFMLYVNGHRLVSRNCTVDPDTGELKITAHEAKRFEKIDLSRFQGPFRKGKINVIAIEGHNLNSSSSDFSLNPFLLLSK